MRTMSGIGGIPALLRSTAFLLVLLSPTVLAAPPQPSARQETVRIGVSSMITPVDTVKYYQEIIDYIGAQIRQPVRMVHRRTYDEMDKLLERGEVKIAFICSAPYVKDHEQFGVELLVAPSINGSPRYRSYVIVHNDTPIKTFPELKGHVFAFTDPKSNTGKIYPTYLLKTMGTDPETFFGRFLYSFSHNKSIEMVAKKIVDGSAVDSLVYEYMRKSGSPYTKQTKIIKRSPPYGTPPVVVVRDIDPALKEKVKNAFLTIQKTPKGKAILEAMMIDGFVEIPDRDYDGIRQMESAIARTATVAKKVKKKNTVYFGIVPRDNPRIMYEKYQPLLDYLSTKTPYAFELVLKKSYEETVTALASGEADIAFLGPLTYLEAHAKYGARCILKPRGSSGSAGYKSVFIKKKTNPLGRLRDLKGKSIAFASFKSTSGNLIPRYLLASSGIHLSDLNGYVNFDYHDSVVKAVLKGQYSAGAVRDSVARKYMKLGIEIIDESETIPTGPLVAGPGMPVRVMENIKRALLDLIPPDGRGKTKLNRLDEDFRNGFIEASDRDYAGIRSKFNAIPTSCGIGCHPKIRW